jgi:homoserine O-succinyltransferase
MRFLKREIEAPPPYPEHYFPEKAVHLAESYLRHAQAAQSLGEPIPDFPETDFESLLDNTWSDTGKALFNNWLGLVYQLTNVDRRIPFAPGVDPQDPLGLRSR